MRRRVNGIVRQSQKALKDLDLIKVIQSEIRHEKSHDRFKNYEGGSPGDFVVDWDSPASQDVFLRRRCDSGEEVAVSALLVPLTCNRDEEGPFPRDLLMKVCIKKPGLAPILRFDCALSCKHHPSLEFNIHRACYLPSASTAYLHPFAYKGPFFSSLDPNLQNALKEYLVAKGIGEDLTNFLALHLHEKEQRQYVSWLCKLEALMSKVN